MAIQIAFTYKRQPQETGAVYNDGMKRLRKNMNLLLKENHSLGFLLKVYHQLFSFLGNKPGAITSLKDYVKELVKVIKMKYSGT